MYIKYNDVNYTCSCRPAAEMVYRGLPADFPAPVSGDIALRSDDGFIMRVDKVEDYLRQTFEDGVLTLTNKAEPVVDEDEENTGYIPGPTLWQRVTALEGALAETDEAAIELYEAMAAQEEINTAQDEALIDLYEMIGG